jgi:hypothetical protein
MADQQATPPRRRMGICIAELKFAAMQVGDFLRNGQTQAVAITETAWGAKETL